jgi:hypothetical protein
MLGIDPDSAFQLDHSMALQIFHKSSRHLIAVSGLRHDQGNVTVGIILGAFDSRIRHIAPYLGPVFDCCFHPNLQLNRVIESDRVDDIEEILLQSTPLFSYLF